MQVYRDLRIITARPTPEEEARVPHRLYGHVDAAVNYSTGQWLRDVGDGARRAGARRPHGDPGRRHRALFQGADGGACRRAADPGRDPQRCARAAHERGRRGPVRRIERARSADRATPDAERPLAHFARAGSGAGDRALAVAIGTAKACRRWSMRRARPRSSSPASARSWCARIETRFAAMLQAGALDEVRALGRAQARPAHCRR